MREAMYYTNSDVRLQELPRPKIGRGELLMKVMATGICGSDVLEWYRQQNAPRVLGHEVTGTIAEVGEEDLYKVGDRIVATHHVPCNECTYCHDDHHTICDLMRKTSFDPGGFSEFLRLAPINVSRGVFPLPSELSFEEGTFVEPLGCAVRGQRHAQIRQQNTVLVLGCGVSGLLHIRLAKSRNVERIVAVDINSSRLEAAEKSGADRVIDGRSDLPKILREINGGRLADRVIVCTGAEPVSYQAIRLVEKGGVALFFAAPGPYVETTIPITQYWLNEIALASSYGASPDDLKQSLELLQTRTICVSDMISHELPLADTGRGFRLVSEAHDCMKVVIHPQD